MRIITYIFGPLTRVSTVVGKTSIFMVLSKCFSHKEIYVDLCLNGLQKCKCVFVFVYSVGDLFLTTLLCTLHMLEKTVWNLIQVSVANLQFFPEDTRTDTAELTRYWIGKALSRTANVPKFGMYCWQDAVSLSMWFPVLLILWITGDCLTQIIENTIT